MILSANKHEAWELKQYQSLSLDSKIRMTQQRIKAWYEHWDGMVYVSFSGGKDSTVLKHIVDCMYDDVPALFVNTGLEYPEIQRFAMSQKNVVTIRPKMRFDEVIKKYGYPVISKDVAKRIKDGRAALRNGNENSYALVQLRGQHMTPEGKKSPFNYEKWQFLLDSPFQISSSCCDVMKKDQYENMKKKQAENLLLEQWQVKVGKDFHTGLKMDAMLLIKINHLRNHYLFGQNKIYTTTSKNTMFLIVRYMVTL